jgi:Ca2+-binding EF-hand superfamily protein/mono/diheme cytochrome c family protein/peroxiredoxin
MAAWLKCCGLLVFFACGVAVAQQDAAIRQGPRVLRGGDHGVGRIANDARFTTLAGKTVQISQLTKQHRAVVIAMTSTSCPLSKKYLPTLVNLARTFSARGIKFVIVNSTAADDLADMRKSQAEFGATAVYVFDRQGALARALGQETTTDVVVLDNSRTVVYHGAIDDQYGFGYSLAAPRNTYLSDALEAALNNRVPTVEATAAPGCELVIDQKPTTHQVTYHGRISRLIQRHCIECHRDGGVAPFALDTLEDVVSHAPMIREVVRRAIMPPWFAAAAKNNGPSPWANDRSLTNTERADLLAWIEGGQVEGDRSDAPKAREFASDWLIGEPDAEFAFSRPQRVSATGIMPYKYVLVDTNLEEDKWIQAIEVRPGNWSVVHHVLVFIAPPGPVTRRSTNGIDYWAAYVPGNGVKVYPKGFARLLPKGARLIFQMHYTPNGTAAEDRTRIGLLFADKPPKHEVKTKSIVNNRFRIPPGAANHQVVASMRVSAPMLVLGFLPHSHLRGKAARYELASSFGESELLLDVPRYDFNWQLFYEYGKPRVFERGETIRYTAWYDNSESNPANPNPEQTVRWGSQTFDEMHIGYIEYALVDKQPSTSSLTNPANSDLTFASLDGNQDGEISREEISEKIPRVGEKLQDLIFGRFDSDRNGTLSESEFNRLRPLIRRR